LHVARRSADLHGCIEEAVGRAAICSRFASVRIELGPWLFVESGLQRKVTDLIDLRWGEILRIDRLLDRACDRRLGLGIHTRPLDLDTPNSRRRILCHALDAIAVARADRLKLVPVVNPTAVPFPVVRRLWV